MLKLTLTSTLQRIIYTYKIKIIFFLISFWLLLLIQISNALLDSRPETTMLYLAVIYYCLPLLFVYVAQHQVTYFIHSKLAVETFLMKKINGKNSRMKVSNEIIFLS